MICAPANDCTLQVGHDQEPLAVRNVRMHLVVWQQQVDRSYLYPKMTDINHWAQYTTILLEL